MNAFITVIPLLIIRFGLLSLVGKESLKRAAFFAPRIGKENTAYLIYQLSNMGMIICLCFLKITVNRYWLITGLVIYGLGVLLCVLSTIDFSRPSENGVNIHGLYKVSRNPMYVAYFIYFLGCALLTQSIVFFVLLVIFQIGAHWIILSEERWCIETFGEAYKSYMNHVRRYI